MLLASLVVGVSLKAQARIARRVIGKPLGEEALVADRVYKKKYGDPIDLVLLGDSVAAGLGADDPGSHAGRGAGPAADQGDAPRRTPPHRGGVGAETSGLADQLASLPPGYRPHVAVIVVGGNDITHRVRVADSRRRLGEAIAALRALGVDVVVGTCPDLGALRPLPQPLRTLGARASRQLAAAQREVTTELGGRAVSLADVVGPFFITQPDEMFALDRFHPSGAGYRRTAKAMLPSVLAALGYADAVPFGHHAPVAALPGRRWTRHRMSSRRGG